MAFRDRRSERFASLLHQLVEERGGRHGAKSEAARAVGISQPYASKILRGDRTNVSDDTIRRAAETLGISIDFFNADGPEDLPYRRFMLSEGPSAWEDWLRLSGSQASEEELTSLRAMSEAAQRTGVTITPALLSAWHMPLRMQALAPTKD